MKLCDNVYQIKIRFKIADKIERYVYVYLITGKYCYLIDTGVAGSYKKIAEYMNGIGRSIKEIKAVFLTHSHPDHIGGAAMIKRIAKCKIYAVDKEIKWMENIENQFAKRPIPDFYKLLNESVEVDEIIKDNDIIMPEDNMSIRVVLTPGHSEGSVSYIYREKNIIFTGDAIPDLNDFFIFENYYESKMSLKKFFSFKNIRIFCPAWDCVYMEEEIREILKKALNYLEKFRCKVADIEIKYKNLDENEKIKIICQYMGWDCEKINPLLKKSIEACKLFNI